MTLVSTTPVSVARIAGELDIELLRAEHHYVDRPAIVASDSR
jgi:hypothetical protein